MSIIPTITVDGSGRGKYKTIQSAIDSIRSPNTNWVCVYIKAGTYTEQVTIPDKKPMIYLQGEGQARTNIVWGNVGITNATFISEANDIVAKDLSFTNSHNYPPNQNRAIQAPAARIKGDKSAFYRCGFYGFQDTLWDANGRHYFQECSITGAIDFICGDGQSIYEKCNINVISKTIVGGVPGYITAQARMEPDGASGFVFKDCAVNGNGPTYLGRPWKCYARVLYYHCSLSNIVVPKGWDTWDKNTDHAALSTFAEKDCYGPGSDELCCNGPIRNTCGRVDWEKCLNDRYLAFLTNINFIDKEGWIMKQPTDILTSDSDSYPQAS